ncbi:MAG: helix-turn-helix transcriptional regulator [Propionibacteriaceae bacterium]|nr:helix-turn-helix transcriptional regulator [Propionibacteriaceae bacterium]
MIDAKQFGIPKMLENTALTVADALSAGHNVLLSGEPLSGRSVILNEVEELLRQRQIQVMHLRGNLGWKTINYGLLYSEALALGLGPGGLFGPTLTARLAKTRNLVVLVDDAPLVDPASAGVLLDGCDNNGAIACTFSCGGETGPLIDGLSPGVCVEISPMSLQDLQQLSEMVLGKPLGPESLPGLMVLSGGRYSLARLILYVSAHNHHLKLDSHGIFRVVDSSWQPELGWAAERLCTALDPETRRLMEEIATTEHPTFSHLASLYSEADLIRLRREALCSWTQGTEDPLVSLRPGLLTLYFRSQSERSSFSKSRSTRPLPLLSELSKNELGMLGKQVTADAYDRLNVEFQSWQLEPTPERGCAALVAFQTARSFGAPQLPDLTSQIARETELDTSDASVRFIFTASAFSAMRGDMRTAQHLVKSAPRPAAMAVCKLFLRFIEAKVISQAQLDVDCSCDPLAAEMLTSMKIWVALTQGRSTVANAELAKWKPSDRRFAQLRDVQQCFAMLIDARFEKAWSLAYAVLSKDRRKLDAALVDVYVYIAQVSLHALGKLDAFTQLSENYLSSSLGSCLRNFFQSAIMATCSLTYMRRGKLSDAHSLSAPGPLTPPFAGPLPRMTIDLVDAVVTKSGRCNAEQAWQHTDTCLSNRCLSAAVFNALVANELGPMPPDVGERLTKALAACDAPGILAIGHFVLASANDDRFALATATLELEKHRMAYLATRARIAHAIACVHQEERAKATALATRAWNDATAGGYAFPRLFSGLRAAYGFTSRENDVLDALAEEESYKGMVQKLSIAQATLETHLLNATKKLGVKSRKTLTLAAHTWLK